jgi:enoyl-CoA hydratase/carnithine racemase
MDLLLSSRVVRADEALEMGLVNRVWPAEDLMDNTYAFAHDLAHHIAPRSLAETKRQVYVDLHRDVGTSVDEAERLLDEMTTEADFAEGVRALGEKRPPEF